MAKNSQAHFHPEQHSDAAIIGSATTGVNPRLAGPVRVELPIIDLDCAILRTIHRKRSA